jgi:aspartyl-tRNA(Asn)/glutamyl-tRNA(Gln) amidotransferase subunit C
MRRLGIPTAAWPCACGDRHLAAIGVGSGLFHTFANGVTALLDVLAIAAFVFVYVFAVNRHVLGWSRGWAWASMLALALYLALATTGFAALPGFAVSSVYWSVCALIAGYGVVLWSRKPAFARGLLIGAAILSVSITARSLDLACARRFPVGTHFLWHILNAIMLGWMIETYRRAVPARAACSGPVTGLNRARITHRARRSMSPMSIDKTTAAKVAKLARIRVEEEDLDALAQDFNAILGFIEQLGELDVDDVEPMTSVTPMRLKRREDVVTDGDQQAKVLANAPDAREGFFAVPKVVE